MPHKDPEVRRIHGRKRLKNFRLRKLGVTLEDYEQMLIDQCGRCALCHKPFLPIPHDPCLDHDHVTGKIRGLLHSTCNKGLGLLGDTAESLRAAADYLEAHSL